MSDTRLEEKNNVNDRGSYFIEKEKTPIIVRFNIYMPISAILITTNIFLALYLSGAFGFSTNDSTDDKDFQDVEYLTTHDEYLTGPTAPNMLFLIGDDIGFSDISATGGLFDTPNIDELVTGGVQFKDFHTHDSCTPSRVAFLTGRYSWKTGLQYKGVVHGMNTAHIPVDEKTFAEVTREMGYDNYYVGRWGVGYASWDYTPLGRGWDKFAGYFGPEQGYYYHTSKQGDWEDVYDFWDMKEPLLTANESYSEDVFLAKTIEYLDEANDKDKPFTLVYGSQTSHTPMENDDPSNYPPIIWAECEQLDEKYKGREYYCNKVKYLDYVWGVIINYLKETGMWDNMLIFATSDNGAIPYTDTDWYGWGCNWPFRGGKSTYYEGGIKNWAGMTGGLVPSEYRGTTFDSLTHIVDLAATAMRLSMTKSEYEARKSLTGTSKIVDGKNLFSFEHHELIVHNVLPQWVPGTQDPGQFDYAASDGEWKYIVGVWDSSGLGNGWYNFPGYGIIDKFHEDFIWNLAGGNCSHGCLFHMETDPYEYIDLSGDYLEISNYFSQLIDAIHRGGFDDSYHPGQRYEEDYRGRQADGIMRPYLNPIASFEYQERRGLVDNNGDYDYQSFSQFWFGDYEGDGNPFNYDNGYNQVKHDSHLFNKFS